MQSNPKRRFRERRLLRNNSHQDAEDIARKRRHQMSRLLTESIVPKFKSSQAYMPVEPTLQHSRHHTIFQDVSVSRYLDYRPSRLSPTNLIGDRKRTIVGTPHLPKSPTYKASQLAKRSLTLNTLDKTIDKDTPLSVQLIQRLIVKNYRKYSTKGQYLRQRNDFKPYPVISTKETIERLLD